MIETPSRFEAAALAAIAQRNEENGQAAIDRANRERLEREARDEDLARAPERDRAILATEREQLAKAIAAVGAAEAAASQAREAIVAGRAAGQPTSSRALDAADAKLKTVRRDRSIAQDIVERLEARMVASVRADRQKRARVELGEILEQWHEAGAKVVAAVDAIDELHRLHEAEEAVARELAAASGVPAYRWSVTHEQKIPMKGLGAEYVRTVDPNLAIALDGTIVSAETLIERLGLR